MRSIHALAIVLAFVAPLAAAAGPSAEPVRGRGIDLPERTAELRELVRPSLGPVRAEGVRRYGTGIGYGGLRGAGSGIRISTMAESAFGPAPARPGPSSGEPRGDSARR